MKRTFSLLAFLVVSLLSVAAGAAEWSVPVAGNAFRSAPAPGGGGFRRDGAIAWSDAEGVFSVFFHVDRPAALDLTLRARVPVGRSSIVARVGERTLDASITGVELALHRLGHIEVPQDSRLEYAYSEITVPEGQDPIGSFFMANGFGEGYFGIQVNGPTERRVLFSVWSPYRTDNPRDIPEDQRIVSLGSGPGVRVGEFGNEGSGGQSYLVYPWKAGVTYRFLTELQPDGQGNTVYTAWFGDKSEGSWRLIASFRRPKTDTHLRGFHAFLESFVPTYGHIGRRAFYGNVWVRDVQGQWHECTRARFSVDPTGRGRHRLDFAGGADGDRFFLRNCGFFHETAVPGDVFTRQSTADQRPEIDVDSLLRKQPST